jgi:Carboxypeptidase regulatory-like domain/Thioredoxin-like
MAMDTLIGSNLRLAAVLAFVVAAGHGGLAGAGDDLALPGRVVELESRKPIAGAEITLGGNDPWGQRLKPEQVVTSDADGRFTLRLRPDRDGERRPALVIRVHHEGYIGRISQPKSAASLRAEAARGAPPFFQSVELTRGEEYRATVVTPDDEPAEGALFGFWNGTSSLNSPYFYDDYQAKADARGRVRVRMVKSPWLNLTATSEQYVALTHQINAQQDRKRYPNGVIPNDLGKLILTRGETISGRVVDLAGKPMAGVSIQAQSPETGSTRSARTDASGAFRLVGLRAGGYNVGARSVGSDDGPRPEIMHPIGPKFVRPTAGGGEVTVELKEVPSVAVEARIVDSKGLPARGLVSIYGQLPPDPKAAAPRPNFKQLLATWRGAPLQNEFDVAIFQRNISPWQLVVEADATGRVVARVPRGISNAQMYTRNDFGEIAYVPRAKSGTEPPVQANVALGDLKEDSPVVEFVAYRCASVNVRVVSEDGSPPPEAASVMAQLFTKGRNWSNLQAERGSDGVYRITGLVPGQPYAIAVNANAYLPIRLEDVTLPEGGSRELTLSLSRMPAPAKVGDLAPPILVTTTDGKARSLADYQGRFLLITVWSARNTPIAMTQVKRVREKFAGDDNLAFLGLSYDLDREALEDYVKKEKVDWPQARLGPEFNRFQAVYGLSTFPCFILIGPDGSIVATNLAEPGIDAALAKALKK